MAAVSAAFERPLPDRPAAGGSSPVAILAPAGRDGAVAETVLTRAGFAPRVCADMGALCGAVEDDVGALLVAEEALAGAGRAALLAALASQPAWSDVPVLVLTGEGALTGALSPALEAMTARANVTLIERPVRVATLVTTLRSALRARRRQLDVRDHLVERSAAEAELRAARAQADAANRAKSEFLAVMSHELRTPLNAIGGYAELIEMGIRGPVTDGQREDLARIRISQRHLLGLINQVLNHTRVESGTLRYDTADVPVGAALAAAEVLVVPQMRAKGLTCVLPACDPELRVRADSDKLQQILLNLLSNAVKFTEPGGRISVTAVGVGGAVAISVADTGVGVASDKLAQIFEPFVQVNARYTRPQEGVGLGLAISRDLARGMGGDLAAESEIGVGSVFTLTLPRG